MAVENVGEDFQYLSFEDIKKLCPSVVLIDGDVETVPSYMWSKALLYVAQKAKLSVVVCHRESIRNLAKERLETPYCCYGAFRYERKKFSRVTSGSDTPPPFPCYLFHSERTGKIIKAAAAKDKL